ncbi:uncharacterized protein K452DRAFT_327609 [Aplosporella prunicola CBS 121167]|uniref:Glc8 protein n=1 Tax=Aplosporella prunicola CBS 121167 TaxID=1176127 RepID=A0A6A6BA65_9PEZI|nr:uncharacterized protein K452DRAFT_327609 [Aplosporella prunicola CBS 121167]KAF2140195.1 hypothetical protein K452DRAFT_327609 [Aplosporella prunicola CBS 121167]
MTQHSPTSQVLHSPPQHHADRPKGILKNPSFTATSPEAAPLQRAPSVERPTFGRELSEKEIVLQNTQINAGHRRSSSNARGPPSRRQSGTPSHSQADENSPRLRWDEANLYLAEQQRDSTMKITEPKTPFAKQYDPTEDEEELTALNAEDLMVDELDKAKPQQKPVKEDEIPDFDLGSPEMERLEHQMTPDGEKRVLVDPETIEDGGRHGEETADMTVEEKEKHRQFEQMRKKHYEMKDVKSLLGHPEELDDEDDEEPPPMPAMPNMNNGQR